MSNKLGKVTFNGKYIDLDMLSRKGLKDVLAKMNDKEMMLKEDLDHILKKLV